MEAFQDILALIIVIFIIGLFSRKMSFNFLSILRKPLKLPNKMDENKTQFYYNLINLFLLYLLLVGVTSIFTLVVASLPAFFTDFFDKIAASAKIITNKSTFGSYTPIESIEPILRGGVFGGVLTLVIARILAIQHSDFLIDVLLFELIAIVSAILLMAVIDFDFLTQFSDVVLNSYKPFPQFYASIATVAFVTTEFLCLFTEFSE